jgi:hypothetical protein
MAQRRDMCCLRRRRKDRMVRMVEASQQRYNLSEHRCMYRRRLLLRSCSPSAVVCTVFLAGSPIDRWMGEKLVGHILARS